MQSDQINELQTIDLKLLASVVQKDQLAPDFEITDWSIQPLTHFRVMDTTGGIYRCSGTGRQGTQVKPWSVILKLVKDPGGEQDPRGWTYWKRELLAYQSGLLESLPSSVCAPRCFGVTLSQANGWLWLEQVQENPPRRWSMERYVFAAGQLGRFNGAYITGKPLPQHPWLVDSFFRDVYGDQSWLTAYMDPSNTENAWNSPIAKRYFSASHQRRILDLWVEKHRFFDALDQLPQTFCHLDAHRRNLMVRRSSQGTDELVAIDWTICGRGAVGLELAVMLSVSLRLFDISPELAPDFDSVLFDAYLDGLMAAGWEGNPDIVRLGYTAALGLWSAGMLAAWATFMLNDQTRDAVVIDHGLPAEKLGAGWAVQSEFALERLDEARKLIRKLRL